MCDDVERLDRLIQEPVNHELLHRAWRANEAGGAKFTLICLARTCPSGSRVTLPVNGTDLRAMNPVSRATLLNHLTCLKQLGLIEVVRAERGAGARTTYRVLL